MIDTHKNVIRYQKEHELHYVNKYVNNPTSLHMARISLIEEKLDWQNNGRNIILFEVYYGIFFNFNIFFYDLVLGFKGKKNPGDTPSAH